METLSDRMRAALEKSGLESAVACRQAKVGLTYIRDIVDGSSQNPSMSRLTRVAKVLKTTPEALMFGAESLPARRAELVRLFDDMDRRQQDAVIAFAQMALDLADAPNQSAGPLAVDGAAAGAGEQNAGDAAQGRRASRV